MLLHKGPQQASYATEKNTILNYTTKHVELATQECGFQNNN